MIRSAHRKPLLLLALLTLVVAGCSDDENPVCPCTSPWQEIDLGLGVAASRVAAVDFTGGYGMAMALLYSAKGSKAGVTHEFYGLQPDGTWLPDDLGDIRAEMTAFDLALDTTGRPVLAGAQIPGPPSVVLDLRGPVPAYIEQNSFGMLTVEGEGSFMVAGGRSSGGGLWTSTGPGTWNFDDLPLTGNNDSGFRDVHILGDRAVACGYDDGADTLQVILTRTVTSDWEKIPAGGPFNATYFCIALSDEGTIFVGGIAGAGGMSPTAFLSQRTADGLWTDLVLPDAELLHGVMDILIAADGSIYLACMGEGDDTQANLIHATDAGVKKEIPPFPGGLLQLGQAADGSVYAVGFRRDDATGEEKGVMLSRSP